MEVNTYDESNRVAVDFINHLSNDRRVLADNSLQLSLKFRIARLCNDI